MEKITLVDAIGNRVPIPIHLCRTYSVRVANNALDSLLSQAKMLAGIIQVYFEEQRLPGNTLVKRGDYQLVSGSQRSVVESSGWTLRVEPGLIVEMSMVRHDKQNRNTSCPRCGLVSTRWAKDEWITWFVFPYPLTVGIFKVSTVHPAGRRSRLPIKLRATTFSLHLQRTVHSTISWLC